MTYVQKHGARPLTKFIPHTSIREVMRRDKSKTGVFHVSAMFQSSTFTPEFLIIFALETRYCLRYRAVWIPVDWERLTHKHSPGKGYIAPNNGPCLHPEGMKNKFCLTTRTSNNFLYRVGNIPNQTPIRLFIASSMLKEKRTMMYIGRPQSMSLTARSSGLFPRINILQFACSTFPLHVTNLQGDSAT